MASATRVACNKEGDGNSNKGDGDEAGKQAMATRAMAMVTATATTWAMAMAMRLAGKEKGKGKVDKGNDESDVRVAGKEEGKGSKTMAMVTRMVDKWTVRGTKRAMATTAMRVVGKQWQWQQRGQWHRQQGWWGTKKPMTMVARAMAMATRVAGEQQQHGRWQRGLRGTNGYKGNGNGNGNGNRNNVGNGNGNEAGGQQRGQG
jgi:hypothetical protein